MLGSVLVAYFYRTDSRLNSTYRELLYCFKNHSPYQVFHLNLAYRIPQYILKERFSMVLVHHTVLAEIRWSPKRYQGIVEKLKMIGGEHVAAFAQDEYFKLEQIERFLTDLNIEKFFSVSPCSEWRKLYPHFDHGKMEQVLTGYVDEETVKEIERIEEMREIDIGYRATYPGDILGSFGKLKSEIGIQFQEKAKDLKTDIVVNERNKRSGDLFYGMDWFRFMKRCKYTLGVESGFSLVDDRKGVNVRTISPRHFEACMAKTCQILVEGDYSGVLEPYEHYIPVKEDFSNVDEVLEIVRKDELREKIVERCYRDIILSGRYSYGSFVDRVIHSLLTEDEIKGFAMCSNKSAIDFLRGKLQFHRSFVEMKCYKLLKSVLPLGRR